MTLKQIQEFGSFHIAFQIGLGFYGEVIKRQRTQVTKNTLFAADSEIKHYSNPGNKVFLTYPEFAEDFLAMQAALYQARQLIPPTAYLLIERQYMQMRKDLKSWENFQVELTDYGPFIPKFLNTYSKFWYELDRCEKGKTTLDELREILEQTHNERQRQKQSLTNSYKASLVEMIGHLRLNPLISNRAPRAALNTFFETQLLHIDNTVEMYINTEITNWIYGPDIGTPSLDITAWYQYKALRYSQHQIVTYKDLIKEVKKLSRQSEKRLNA